MAIFDILDLLGTMAFAISGVMVALKKKLDLFGVFIIAFVTALGGGTIRDILIDNVPVSWMLNLNYVFSIIIAVIIALIFRNKFRLLNKSLFLFDTIGLGIFTITGTEIGINADFHPIISIALGTISASFGGVIRDILCNEIPVIFRKEIYATACIFGAIIFIILHNLQLESTFVYIITVAIVIIIRLIAVKFSLSLPSIYRKSQ